MDKQRTELLEKIMLNTGELHRCFATTRDSFLAQFDLSRPQLELLLYLKGGQATVSELAKNFQVTPSAISQMVSQLDKDGLVSREVDIRDKRVSFITLSNETRSVFTKVRKKFAERLSQKFVNVTQDELALFLGVLEKMNIDLKMDV